MPKFSLKQDILLVNNIQSPKYKYRIGLAFHNFLIQCNGKLSAKIFQFLRIGVFTLLDKAPIIIYFFFNAFLGSYLLKMFSQEYFRLT